MSTLKHNVFAVKCSVSKCEEAWTEGDPKAVVAEMSDQRKGDQHEKSPAQFLTPFPNRDDEESAAINFTQIKPPVKTKNRKGTPATQQLKL